MSTDKERQEAEEAARIAEERKNAMERSKWEQLEQPEQGETDTEKSAMKHDAVKDGNLQSLLTTAFKALAEEQNAEYELDSDNIHVRLSSGKTYTVTSSLIKIDPSMTNDDIKQMFQQLTAMGITAAALVRDHEESKEFGDRLLSVARESGYDLRDQRPKASKSESAQATSTGSPLPTPKPFESRSPEDEDNNEASFSPGH